MAMTAQQRRGLKWGAVLTGIAAAGTIASVAFGGVKGTAKAAAAEQLQPVAERVTRLEEQRKSDKEQLEKMDKKLDTLLERVR